MKIAFIIYEGVTALDFIGAYDPISRLITMDFMKDLSIDICSNTDAVIDFSKKIQFVPTVIKKSLEGYDMILVPGGFGSRKLMKDDEFLAWIQTSRPDAIKASVCTGALILGAAGFLRGKHATTHFNNFEALKEFCEKVEEDKRIVEDGNVITARGVSAGIDLGLYICEKLQGKDVKEKIARQMDYRME